MVNAKFRVRGPHGFKMVHARDIEIAQIVHQSKIYGESIWRRFSPN
jgi:hypothetical protein